MSRAVSQWFVYLVRCSDGSLYTGITTDVERRLQEHQETASRQTLSRKTTSRSKGAKALRGKGPLRLAFAHPVANRSVASRMEYRVKQLEKAGKERLVRDSQHFSALLETLEI